MKGFAILVVAVFAVAMMENQSEAQFHRGFGGSGFSVGFGTGGFNRGFGGFNSFNRGFGGVGFSSFNRGFGGGFNSFGPSYSRSFYRPSYGRSFSSGGFRGGCGY